MSVLKQNLENAIAAKYLEGLKVDAVFMNRKTKDLLNKEFTNKNTDITGSKMSKEVFDVISKYGIDVILMVGDDIPEGLFVPVQMYGNAERS